MLYVVMKHLSLVNLPVMTVVGGLGCVQRHAIRTTNRLAAGGKWLF